MPTKSAKFAPLHYSLLAICIVISHFLPAACVDSVATWSPTKRLEKVLAAGGLAGGEGSPAAEGLALACLVVGAPKIAMLGMQVG